MFVPMIGKNDQKNALRHIHSHCKADGRIWQILLKVLKIFKPTIASTVDLDPLAIAEARFGYDEGFVPSAVIRKRYPLVRLENTHL